MQAEITQGIRLSPQQRRLWRLQSEGGVPAHAECVVAIEGNLDREVLRSALERVVQRHDALRLRFYRLPGMTIPLQVTEGSGVAWQFDDEAKVATPETKDRAHNDEAEFQIDFGQDETLSAELVAGSQSSHLLFMHLPTLCCDEQGLENLVREIGKTYEAILHDGQALDEPLQYTVVAEWLNELLESEESAIGRDYWQQSIRAANLNAKLPFEKPPAAATEFAPQLVTAHLHEDTLKGLAALADSHGTTVEVVLLACYVVLLWRLTGESPVTVGLGANGRSDEELERAIGLLTKFLPINSQLNEDTRFVDLLEQLSIGTSEAQDWQECFTWELFDETDLFTAGEPFFPFCFSFRQPAAKESAAGVSFSIHKQTAWVDRFGLKLSALFGGDALQLGFHYDAALFAQEDIERLRDQFQRILESTIAKPAARIVELNLLSDAERELVLYKFNQTQLDFGKSGLLHQLVEQQAKLTPAGVALIWGGQQLTYQELNERANQLAHHLQGLGIGTESLVAVSLQRSPELVVTLLAILKTGGAYVPLDPGYPAERLAFMLEDSKAAVLVTERGSSAWMDHLSKVELRVVSLEDERELIAAQRTANPLSPVEPANLAYVIYTSGSTGRPKAVMVSHGAICNRLLWMQHGFPLTAADRVLQKTTFSFDASVWEIFSPLLAGGCVVLAEVGGERDAVYLAGAVAEHEVTVLQLVPSMLRVWLEEAGKCVSLRRVFSGGEALNRETSERFSARLGGVELVNLYGPTEAAIDATFYECREGYTGNLVPIGRPLSNMQVYLLARPLEPVWLGVAGELYIGGVGVARGYLNQPALTAERFIPDPFSAEPGKRLYRTGDLAVRRPDGRIEFLGRIDSQVKLRGYRIELGEIETALRQHPAVQDSVVAVREDVPGDQRLVAYLTPRPNQASDTKAVSLYRLPNGVEIAHLNKNETDHLYEEIFRKQNYLRNNVTLRDGDCIFDVGANIGMFTLFVNDVCRDARIFAFEPIPTTFAALQYNIGAFGLKAKPYHCGLSDRSGSANFTFYPKVSASSGMYADAFADEQVTRAYLANQDEQLVEFADELMEGRFETQSVVCPLKTISEVISENQIERVDLLKLDVEKSELDVLRGIQPDDWPKIKQLVAEVHDIDGRLDEFSGILKSHGFDVMLEQDESFKATGLHHIYAIHPSRSASHDNSNGRPHATGSYLHQRTLAVSGLQSYLKERLPEYMIPTAFVRLEALPKLANGKVDRQKLPAPDTARPELDDDYTAPRNSMEERIAAVWAELLNLERVGIHDNFFELGGHSLLATKAISSLQEQFNVELPLRRFFETPTVAGVAVGVVETLADPLADDQMAEILAQLESLPVEGNP